MARCSCPDPAGKLGKCKHVVAMLMKFIDKDSSKVREYLGSVLFNTLFTYPEESDSRELKQTRTATTTRRTRKKLFLYF